MKLPGLLRLEYFLVTNARVVVALMVAISVLSLGAMTVGAIAPPNQEVQEQVNQQTVTTEVDHHAVVTSNNTLWESGTVLENRDFYPMGGTSDLTLTVRTSVDGADKLYGSQSLSIVYFSKVNGNRIWQRSTPVAPNETRYADDEIVSTYIISVSDIFDQVDRYNEQLTGVSTTSVELRLQVNYSTLSYSGGTTSTVGLKLSTSGYQLGGSFDTERSHSTTVTRTAESPPDHSTLLGLFAIALFSGVAAGGTRRLSQRKDPGPIRDEIHRQRCSEWISAGRIRQPIGGQDVMMRSLEDLVYVAIDSKERVIHDPDRDLYAIMDDGMLYYYDPLEDPSEDAMRSEEVAPESDTSVETADLLPDDEAVTITIEDDGNHAWGRLMAEEPSGDDPGMTEDSTEEQADDGEETRAWNRLMDGRD